MDIQLNHREPRDETRQIAFITVSGVNAQAYRFQVGDVPIELETDQTVLDHLNSREKELHLWCLRKTYPGADPSEFKTEENTDLEAFLEWEEAGCKNPDDTVITNHLYAGTHPERYPPSQDELETALGILDIANNMSYSEIDDFIEENISTLASAKDYLKKLSKTVLALMKLVDHKQ